jgi:hypothetical protein
MKLQYVFDHRETEGYAMRVPLVVVRLVTHARVQRVLRTHWDYWHTLDGS